MRDIDSTPLTRWADRNPRVRWPLIAAALLYGVTGTLNMADMAERVAKLSGSDATLARAGLFPFRGLEQATDRRRTAKARVARAELRHNLGILFLVADDMPPQRQRHADAKLIIRQRRAQRVGLPEGMAQKISHEQPSRYAGGPRRSSDSPRRYASFWRRKSQSFMRHGNDFRLIWCQSLNKILRHSIDIMLIWCQSFKRTFRHENDMPGYIGRAQEREEFRRILAKKKASLVQCNLEMGYVMVLECACPNFVL
jgi:hypothetical protein